LAQLVVPERKNGARALIYLDAFSTTPLDPRIGMELRPWFEGQRFGNAGSPHEAGEMAAEAVHRAKRSIGALLNATSSSVVLTSGATESNNLALTAGYNQGGGHVVVGSTEHPSVREPLRALAKAGCIELSCLGVDREGNIDLDDLRDAVRPDTTLISLMAANNETGTLHPVREIGAIAQQMGALFHCDAAQAAGKIPLNVVADGVDLLSISAHKMYGPMGVGALVVSERARVALQPLLRGGGQESGLRSGTVNVPGVVGLGAACRFASDEMRNEAARLARQRDYLETALVSLGDITVNGNRDRRLPGSLSVTIEGVPADALLAGCPNLAFSRGSACSTGSPKPSQVLMAMGFTSEEADSTVRFGLTRNMSTAEIETAVTRLCSCIERVRGLVHA
jgi:cysteine desulfurase